MRVAEQTTIPTTAASVHSLITKDIDVVHELVLQAPESNIGNIFFGDRVAQPGFIKPGGSVSLTLPLLKQTYIVGTLDDSVIILVPSWDRT